MAKKFVDEKEKEEVAEAKVEVKKGKVVDPNEDRRVNILARNEARRLEGEVALATSLKVHEAEVDFAKLEADKAKLEVDRVELARQEEILKKMQENFDAFKKGVKELEAKLK